MKFAIALIVSALAAAPSSAQDSCSNIDTGKCDLDPFNPVVCGPDKKCGYDTRCNAEENGYDVDADCCQAPSPAACTGEVDPQICGDKQCPYDNLCIATLAGYTEEQCTSAPAECPAATDPCEGDPQNRVKCGPGKSCQYENYCLATSAGFDPIGTDCCQDVQADNIACTGELFEVVCGPPEKQCPYSNQCVANAAGYSSKQCCPAVPEGLVCTADFAPVQCGDNPCQYSNLCQAEAAGFAPIDCCPKAEGACAQNIAPVECGGLCPYANPSCAEAAGWDTAQCCAQPTNLATCTQEYTPVACGSANCIYDNECIATLAGFDFNSCVSVAGIVQSTNSGSGSSTKSVATALSVLALAAF